MADARLLLLLCGLGACGRCEEPSATPGDSATPTQSAAPARVAVPPGPWEEAAADDLAAQRLGLAHDARTLLAVARDHPDRAAAALNALAHAGDAELALAGLAELARASAPLRGPALHALVKLSRRRPLDERLDPRGIAQCVRTLDALSRDRTLEHRWRALAVSALRGFARAGFVDARSITTELDPPPG